jgi:predicted transcriptional regulator
MDEPISNIENIKIWQVFVIEIIKSFTTYGLLVLLAVTTWKHSKAKFDQAERFKKKTK